MVTRAGARKAEQRARATVLLGGRCVACGSTERLEFDHIDWRTKATHTHILPNGQCNLFHYRWDYIMTVLKDYQLLCHGCHKAKTRRDRAEQHGSRENWIHGTITGYTRYKCRCDDCMQARRVYFWGWEMRRCLAQPILRPYLVAVLQDTPTVDGATSSL